MISTKLLFQCLGYSFVNIEEHSFYSLLKLYVINSFDTCKVCGINDIESIGED